jgi:hypothetical protein
MGKWIFTGVVVVLAAAVVAAVILWSRTDDLRQEGCAARRGCGTPPLIMCC